MVVVVGWGGVGGSGCADGATGIHKAYISASY